MAAATKDSLAHPKYLDMTTEAINSLGEKTGSSRQAILRYIIEHYDVLAKNEKVVNSHLKMALRRGVESGDLKQLKGTGASGSFKIGEVTKAKEKAEAKLKVDKEKVKLVKQKTDKVKVEKKKVAEKPAKKTGKPEAKTKITKPAVAKKAVVKKTTKVQPDISTPKKTKAAKALAVKAKPTLKTPKRTQSAVSKTKKPKAEKPASRVAVKKTKAVKKPATDD